MIVIEVKGGGGGGEGRRDGNCNPINSYHDYYYSDDDLSLSLSIEESEEISRIVNALAEECGCEIISYCMYGSKVAGYARPDSDYDILLVLKDYSSIIKYVYVRNRLNASVLIVDGRALVKDAEHAMLGEFVAGRLLHPYLPLWNGEYLREVETLYKKRIIMEEYGSLLALNPLLGTGEFSIPLEYFLFSKLRKRARAYPHALYSYVKTYTGSHASRNLKMSMDGFGRALRELEREGSVEIFGEHANSYSNHVILKERAGNRTFIREMLMGMFAWLVHSYAARRSLGFFREEARSKLKRRREIKAYTMPQVFTNPTVLLRASEGVVVDGNCWLDMIARSLGFSDGYSTRFTGIGDKHAAATLCTLEQDGRRESIVIKYYTNLKMAKWVALNVWLAGIRRYDVSPERRMMNEYIGARRVRALGIHTPEIVAISFGKRIIAFRYVHGTPLSEIIRERFADDRYGLGAGGVTGDEMLRYVREYGSLLGRIHANGFVLRDTKPSNVLILSENGVMLYLTDFEQFHTSESHDDMGWDIACFLYYSMLFISAKKEDMVRRFVRSFIEGYLEHGSHDAIVRAARGSYFLPFYPAMVIGIIRAIREEMRSFISQP